MNEKNVLNRRIAFFEQYMDEKQRTVGDRSDRKDGHMSYISRQDVLDIALQYCPDDDGTCSKSGDDLRNMLDEIENLPSAPVREVVYGEWVIKNGGLYCSKCGSKALLHDNKRTQDYDYRESKFCPNCGASMR